MIIWVSNPFAGAGTLIAVLVESAIVIGTLIALGWYIVKAPLAWIMNKDQKWSTLNRQRATIGAPLVGTVRRYISYFVILLWTMPIAIGLVYLMISVVSWMING